MVTISIACIDTRDHNAAISAINKTAIGLQHIGLSLGNIYWFSDLHCEEIFARSVTYTQIDKIIFPEHWPNAYNKIMLDTIPSLVCEDGLMVVQWDGFIVNPQAWTSEFLEYDYIGAVWPWLPNTPVGNGGFSMRSQKLMHALKQMKIAPDYNNDGEDAQICRYYRGNLEQNYGIKFAPAHVADKVSIEMPVDPSQTAWLGQSLGFHGKTDIVTYYKGYRT